MKRNNIPAELRSLPQWVVANDNKIPHNPRTGATASPTNPATWGTYEEAIKANHFKHIGFVLSEHNNLTIIDLDDKAHAPATSEQRALHTRILSQFQSYTEKSQSGSGFHIIVRGKIPAGVHRDNVEMYSSGRYMICTGDVTKQLPVNDYQAHLDSMFAQMRPQEDVTLVQVDSDISDADIVEMASNASNGEKFVSLCKGDITGYPGQSEADLAIMSILAFYSKDNEQVMRIFRHTELGKRDKATRNDKYLTYTLKRIRSNEAPPIDFAALAAQAQSQPAIPESNGAKRPATPLPPGLVGEVAQYIYQSAVRPVPEIALAASLAFFSGLCGRQYNTYTGAGLNQYIIMLAGTGRGKEGAHTGIDQLFGAIRTRIPAIDTYRGAGSYSSEPAVVKALAEKPSQVAVLGEFGLLLQRISGSRSNSAEQSLLACLLNIYGKSGRKGILQAMRYSDKEKNTVVVVSPNLTLLGESTPDTFYSGLDEGMVAAGLIPRFIIMEYLGDRPAFNKNAGFDPDTVLLDKLCRVAETVMRMAANNGVCSVPLDPVATSMDDAYEIWTTHEINRLGSSPVAELWNRAHLKTLKLASLLAVGVNPDNPIVTGELYHWAETLSRSDVTNIAERFSKGDVGEGDSKMQNDLLRIISKYPQAKTDPKYPALAKLQAGGIFPLAYILPRTSNLNAFKSHKLGSNYAAKTAIQNLVDCGTLQEIPKAELAKQFGYLGQAYAVVS